ncbi:glycosyltransferase [Candidatus Woesearchaeota archaeon]|nr:glycosyltransferase [Candidatus Woesearchaeota archaeon]
MKVAAIVPVYNEERTVGGVLNTLASSDRVNEIIIVDGASTDKSPEIINKFKKIKKPKIYIINLKNRKGGKGMAIKIASKNLKSDIVMLFDSDLVNLTKEHVNKLVEPIINKEASMVIGLRDKNNAIGNMLMPYFPLTGGERAFSSDVFMKIMGVPLIEGWGLESVMNNYCKKKKLKVAKVKLDGMDHIGLQTKKFGLSAFVKEIYDVILTKIKLIGVKYN